MFLYQFVNYTGYYFAKGISPRNQAQITPVVKEYLLHTFECLFSQICKHDAILIQMENIIATSVLNELQSEEGFLRARACSVFSYYGTVEFENDENLSKACQGICNCMTNNALPVRVQATSALSCILQQDKSKLILQGDLQQILEII